MSIAASPKRRKAHAWGIAAERRAAVALRLKGYDILAMREKTAGGEIDLIARRGKTIAFVEVKARVSETAGLEAVTPEKSARLARAAEAWIARHPRYASHTLRFDVVVVMPWRWPRHMKDAWRA